uniref:F-box domain-containing protein n=1 Tax=Panagrolaimus sp. JU765 TaxID=591449 RepID=A0AC34Q075_9BILA
MEYFNFLGLPDVVQDLVVHEIVHNSIPNDRIQLARTCKYLNEAVKRAKPRKIVEKLDIRSFDVICFLIGTKVFQSSPTPEFVTNICHILQQTQAEKLRVVTTSFDVGDSGFFHHLFEASKFVTELKIYHHGLLPEFTEFYNKLEHLEFLEFGGSIDMFNSLSHYPSRIRLNTLPDYDSNLLENITKKTKLLSSLFVKRCIPVEKLQQFLQTGKFKNGCEIYCEVENSEGKKIHIFLTFIDDEQGFEIETFPIECLLMIADQNLHQNDFLSPYNYKSAVPGILFDVNKKTQPTEPLIYDYITDDSLGTYEEEEYILENVEENDWIKINFDDDNVYVHYSHQMLVANFPRNDYSSALERLGDINNVLGCKIKTIKAEMLSETIQNLENGRICVSM